MTYDQLKLEKGMYGVTGKSFTKVLEEMDPSEQYVGTKLEGLDAFERQLKRFDIKVAGRYSDPVEKFFSTTASAALFPEYVKRAVIAGTNQGDILSQIIASKTYIDSLDYRSVTSVIDETNEGAPVVAEGTEIPTMEIKTKDNLVKLKKRGKMLVASYEAIRFQKLDLFTVALKQIGAQIAKQQLADAVTVLTDGDGNDNAAEAVALLGGSFTYNDLVNLWSKFEDFEMNTLLAGNEAMKQLLSLPEFQNPLTGLNFAGTGKLSTPLGANLFQTKAVADNTLIAFDKNCSLEMVTVSDVMVDYDKLIDRQLERASITSTTGFAKIFADAGKVMTVA